VSCNNVDSSEDYVMFLGVLSYLHRQLLMVIFSFSHFSHLPDKEGFFFLVTDIF